MKTHSEKIRQKGRNEIAHLAEKHLKFCHSAQKKHNDLPLMVFLCESEAQDVKLPRRTKSRISSFRDDLRAGVVKMVERIEDLRFNQLKRLLDKQNLSPFQTRQSHEIHGAIRDILVSYHSITQAFDVIRHFNKKLLRKIEKAKGNKKTELMLFNAILTFEITDVAVEMLGNFQWEGREQLAKICQAVEAQLNKQQKEDDELYAKLEGGKEETRKAVSANIQERRRIREVVESKWNEIWERVDNLEKRIQQIGGRVNELEIIRDNAKAQIDILQVVGVAHLIQSSLDSLDRLCSVSDIQLAPLSADDVLTMIGQPFLEI